MKMTKDINMEFHVHKKTYIKMYKYMVENISL